MKVSCLSIILFVKQNDAASSGVALLCPQFSLSSILKVYMSMHIGPNRYLPGQVIPVKVDEMCDVHMTRKAVTCIVGETDSMGSEVLSLCQECFDQYQQNKKQNKSPDELDYCEIHQGDGKNVKSFRDPEEGYYGRIYRACESCRKKIVERFVDDYK